MMMKATTRFSWGVKTNRWRRRSNRERHLSFTVRLLLFATGGCETT